MWWKSFKYQMEKGKDQCVIKMSKALSFYLGWIIILVCLKIQDSVLKQVISHRFTTAELCGWPLGVETRSSGRGWKKRLFITIASLQPLLRRPGFKSQHPHGISQMNVIPVPGDPSNASVNTRHKYGAQTHMQATYIPNRSTF